MLAEQFPTSLPIWINSEAVSEETKLVIAAAASTPPRGLREWVLRVRPNWDLVWQESLRLGVAPLVGEFLTQHCADGNPPSRFGELIRNNAIRNLKLTAELFRIERLCAERGIQLVSFKGPTLTEMVYGDLSRRAFGDLDVWVEKQNVLAVSRLLHERGYDADLEWESADATFLEVCHQIQFVCAEADLMVELHWGFWPKYLAQDFSAELVTGNLAEARPGGKSLTTMKPELLLLYLCLHGAKHPWETLGQIVDVARLIERFSDLDWSQVVSLAKAQRVERILWLGLFLASELVGVRLPEEITLRIRRDGEVKRLAATAARWLFCGGEGPQNKPQTTAYYFRLQQGLWRKLHFLWRLLMVPTYSDWKMIRLPIAWLPIYPLLRPFRLLKKYARLA